MKVAAILMVGVLMQGYKNVFSFWASSALLFSIFWFG